MQIGPAGGVVQDGGATLTIPAGALAVPASITLNTQNEPSTDPQNPIQGAGKQAGIDLHGATLAAPATLDLPYTTGNGELVELETVTPAPTDGQPGVLVHAIPGLTTMGAPPKVVFGAPYPLGRPKLRAAGISLFAHLSISRSSIVGVYLIPTPTEGINNTSLQVPFYWQAGFPWCVPTSLAMTLNYYQTLGAVNGRADAPGGRLANYSLAGLNNQSRNSGGNAGAILNELNIPPSNYQFASWDPDLMPSTAFTSYVVLATTGIFGLFPAKPVWISSDRLWHAFVLTGLSADGVYLNDGNDRWSGTRPNISWTAFQKETCRLKDANDPNSGCDTQPNVGGLWTLLFNATPRPETERRGSMELYPDSFAYTSPLGEAVTNWYWEGLNNLNGYVFDDPSGSGRLLPFDSTYGRLLPRSGNLSLNLNIVNITNASLPYTATARLLVGTSMVKQLFQDSTVPGYTRSPVNFDFGKLADSVPALGGPTDASLEINLTENGVVQDVKRITFRLAPDPGDAPSVTIDSPNDSATVLTNSPVDLKASVYDPHTLNTMLPAANLSWTVNGAGVANALTTTYTFANPGSYQIQFSAVGAYGLMATKSVTVTAIDPTRTPGNITIVSPANNAKFVPPGGGRIATVNVSGYATYGDGSAVPASRLHWTVDGYTTPIGDGSNLTTQLSGGCGFNTYTVRLTVRSAAGVDIGSATSFVTVYGAPC